MSKLRRKGILNDAETELKLPTYSFLVQNVYERRESAQVNGEKWSYIFCPLISMERVCKLRSFCE